MAPRYVMTSTKGMTSLPRSKLSCRLLRSSIIFWRNRNPETRMMPTTWPCCKLSVSDRLRNGSIRDGILLVCLV